MATEQSLFGATPESIQQAREAALNTQASQYAQLDPFQRASFNIYRGANQLGGAVGGMLGGTDPQMLQMQKRQQLIQGINPNDPDSLKQAIERAMSANDYPAAQEFATRLQTLQAKTASTAKDVASASKERQLAIPADLLKAQREAALRQGIRSLEADTSPEALQTKKNLEDELAALTRVKEPLPIEIQRLQDYRDTLPVGSAARREVDKIIEAEGRGKGTSIINQLPGVKGAGDLIGLRKDINITLKPYRDTVDAADQAISLADDVLKTGNFASSASLARSLAKASGETQLSKADVAAFGGDPSFVGSVSDIASRIASGTPTADTTRKLKSLATLLKKKNSALEKNEITQLQNTARLSGLYTDEQIKNVFTLRGETKGTTRKTAGGVSYTVED